MENTKKNLKNIRFVNLKGFRLSNELSQKEVAEYLEVSIAFISAVERGLAKLPSDKLVRLLENENDWETAPLLDPGEAGTRIHQDYRSISNNIEGEFNAPVHNNNYSGYSDEEFEKELQRRTELKDQQIRNLEEEIERLRMDLARERSMNERFMSILEKGEFRRGEDE